MGRQGTPLGRRCGILPSASGGNLVLWNSGNVSGIVDWPNACVGPRSVDIAHCRLNLVALFGLEAADRFLDAYLRRVGSGFDYDRVWDLNALLETAREPLVYRPWLEFGAALTEQDVRERREIFLLRALAKRSG